MAAPTVPTPLAPGTAATAATPTPSFLSRPPEGLAGDLAAIVTQGVEGSVELHLSPEELGRVQVSLQPDGDHIHLTIQVERPETLDLLRRHSDALLQEMRQAGFSGANLSFSGWSGDGRAPGGAPLRAEAPVPLADAAAPPRLSLSELAATAASLAPGTLDLRL